MKRLLMMALVGCMVTGSVHAQGLGALLGGMADLAIQGLLNRTRVVNPRCEAAFGVVPLCSGTTVELRADEGNFEQARRVEQAFQRMLKLNADQAMSYALEDKQLQQLIEAGLKEAFGKAGCSEVLTADEIRSWTAQRQAERANDEVRQGSMPARGTLERPLYVVRWRWVPVAGVNPNVLLGAVTLRNVSELTSQLSLSVQLADSGLTVATFVVPVQVQAAGSMWGESTYSRPFIHAMMTKSTLHLGEMLVDQVRNWDKVCLGQLKLQVGPQIVEAQVNGKETALPKLVPSREARYRVFTVYQRHAILTVGQEEGLVGTGDAGNQPVGSSVWVGGFEFRLGRTARRLALISLDGQPLAAQEALSRPDAPVTWPGMPQPATSSGAAAAPAPSQSGDVVTGQVRVYKD